ncbi:dorsal-ventral patterning tolloid-like protein 1 [Saccoglossus kowalevskii]|uniref:Tolloid-like protein 2-like n=1 Tax=Saccoglossus kowalevskii TaxID=10224 RepID=A0ABM0LVF3_SACKO|nr:PREDICTED: tolloid-like protein 2-like [Saccoglossus kowalevskii]
MANVFICCLFILLTILPLEIAGCEDQLVEIPGRDDVEHIQAPGYPENYPPLQECKYSIIGKEGYKVRVEFEEFYLERRSNSICFYDYVEFFDGASEEDHHLGRFCDQTFPSPVVSTTNKMLIIFVSDDAIEPGTFVARIENVPLTYQEPYEIGECGGLLTDTQGVFSSPGYPYGYEENEFCIFTITVDTGKTIELHFTTFDIESHPYCEFDFIEVIDGRDIVNSPVIGTYCGGSSNKPPQIMSSTGNSMMVLFSSDISLHYEGFYAEYAISEIGFPDLPPPGASPSSQKISVCDISRAIVTDRGGVIVSHENYPDGQYPNFAQCIMVIIGSRMFEKVYLSFKTVDLQPTQDGACQPGTGDYIEIVDGDRSLFNPTLLGRLCAGQEESFVSGFMYLQLNFVTDRAATEDHTGFEAVFTVFYEDTFGCETGDFQCRNDRCIADYLVCDGYNHCGDNTDEDTGCGLAETDDPDYDRNRQSNHKDSKGGLKVGLTVGISVAVGAIIMASSCLVAIKCYSKKSQRTLSTSRLTNIAVTECPEISEPTMGHDNPLYQREGEQAPPVPPKYSEIDMSPPIQQPANNFFSPAPLSPIEPFSATGNDTSAPPLEQKDASLLQSDHVPLSPPSQPLPSLGDSTVTQPSLRGANQPLPPLGGAPLSVDLPSREVLYNNNIATIHGAENLPPLRGPGRLPPLGNIPPLPHSDA